MTREGALLAIVLVLLALLAFLTVTGRFGRTRHGYGAIQERSVPAGQVLSPTPA